MDRGIINEKGYRKAARKALANKQTTELKVGKAAKEPCSSRLVAAGPLPLQVPGHVLVTVPPGKRTNAKGYRLIRTKVKLDRGIVSEKSYRIVSVERADLEGLKFSTKIGKKTVIKAAREALARRNTAELRLGKAAKEFSLESVLVVTASGRGIRNVFLRMDYPDGTNRTARTSTFGYFHFYGSRRGRP